MRLNGKQRLISLIMFVLFFMGILLAKTAEQQLGLIALITLYYLSIACDYLRDIHDKLNK